MRNLRPREVKLFARDQENPNSNPQNLSPDLMFATTKLYYDYRGLNQ